MLSIYRSRMKLLLSKSAIAAALLFAVVGSASSSSFPAYFSIFKSVCLLMEIDSRSATKIEQSSLQAASKFAAAHIHSALQKTGFERPVEIGRNCFRRTLSHPHEISLWFVASVRELPEKETTAISMLMHLYYGSNAPSPHEFPTEVSFCGNRSPLSECLSTAAIRYFDESVAPIFRRGKEVGVPPQ